MINHKVGDLNITLPDSWEQVTLGQFQRIRNNKKLLSGNIIELISILSGLRYEDLFDAVLPDEEVDIVIDSLKWFEHKPDFDSLPMPEIIYIDKKAILIPKIISSHFTLGQKQESEKIIFDSIKSTGDEMACMADVLSIILYKDYTGNKFDEDWREVVRPAILRMKAVEAYPVAGFFLRKYYKSLMSKQRLSYQDLRQKKFKQALETSTVSES